MKKNIKVGLMLILIVVLAVCAWFIGYHTRKSQDNLPSLESISKMDEAAVNELLVGVFCVRSHLESVISGTGGNSSILSRSVWYLA